MRGLRCTGAGATSLVYDLLGLSRRTQAGRSTYELRSPGGQLLSERDATGTSYVLFDALGSTIGLARRSTVAASTRRCGSRTRSPPR